MALSLSFSVKLKGDFEDNEEVAPDKLPPPPPSPLPPGPGEYDPYIPGLFQPSPLECKPRGKRELKARRRLKGLPLSGGQHHRPMTSNQQPRHPSSGGGGWGSGMSGAKAIEEEGDDYSGFSGIPEHDGDYENEEADGLSYSSSSAPGGGGGGQLPVLNRTDVM